MPHGTSKPSIIRAKGASEITWGTPVQMTNVSGTTALADYTWSSQTGITGHDKCLVVIQWVVQWPKRNDVFDPEIKVNGTTATLLVQWSYNSGFARYQTGQVTIGWIDNPTNGDVFIDFDKGRTWTYANRIVGTVLPFDGAPSGASAFGTPVVTTSTSLTIANSLTTTVANTSHRISAMQARHHNGLPITYDDTSMTVIREESLGASTDDLSTSLRRKQNGATGSKSMGGAFKTSGAASDDDSSCASFEVFAA